jgi:signal transduction histidine kinase
VGRALLLVLLAAGCVGDDALSLTEWTLAGQKVSLPAHLDLPRERSVYRLEADVELPPRFRGQTLTLALPAFAGLAWLEVDRKMILAIDEPAGDDHRAITSQRFQIPSELTRHQRLSLTLVVSHVSSQSAWIDAAPLLSATPGGDRWTRFVIATNTASNTVLLVVIVITGSAYLAIFLRDRRRTRHGWLALGTFCVAWLPLYNLGFAQTLLGVWDTTPFLLAVPLGSYASVRFLYAHLGRPCPRAWALVVAIPLAAAPFLAGPFVAMPWGSLLVSACVPTVIAAQLVMPLRAMFTRQAPPGTFVLWAGWFFVIATAWPDMMPWSGLGAPLGGLQTASFGFIGFLLTQALALAREHSLSLDAADKLVAEQRELSAELLRQLREREADAERRRLFADLAHELGTPTSSVIGIAETLRSGVAPDHSAKLLELLEREGARLERLVGDVRLLAFLEQPDLQLEIAPCDVAELAEAACARAELDAKEKRIEVRCEVARPATAPVDRLRIEQVLANLLSNALRYAPEGGVVRLTVSLPDEGKVRLAIEDSGTGVADEMIEKLGERFLRLDPSRTRRTGGHGLGLAIVTTIVQRHGGTIRFGRAGLGGLGVTIDLVR